jgi:ribonuclease-3
VARPFVAIKLLFSRKKQCTKEIVALLGYKPKNSALYDLAFVHRSAPVQLPDGSTANNERLEFLGDAILDALVAEYLFSYYPNKDEGFLSKMRSKIVKRKHLNSLAISVGIDKLIVTNSININGGKHICGNAFEALVGAIYLDCGYGRTREFIINKILKAHINLELLELRETDFKSRIIEWAQKKRNEISFECQEEYTGKEHAPIFVSRILVSGQIMGQGKGTSKKEAEQNAAEQAYCAITDI